MASTRRLRRLSSPFTVGLTVRVDTAEWRRRVQLGRLTRPGMQRALFEAHSEMARTVQRYATEELERRHSPRPQRPESLLSRSILDEQNREVTPLGFQVGLESWLFHRAPAWRYARRIEFGGPNPMAAVGPIVGYFWFPGAGPFPPRSITAGSRQEASEQLSGRLRWRSALGSNFAAAGPGAVRRGKTTAAQGAWFVRAQDVVAREGGYHLHERAGERFTATVDMTAVYQKHLDQVGLRWIRLRRGA